MIRLKLFLPLLSAVTFMLVLTIFFVLYIQKEAIYNNKEYVSKQFLKTLNDRVDIESSAISQYMDLITQNDEIINEFRADDKSKLYDSVKDIYLKLRKNVNITHLYFIKTDGEVLLRVHDYDRDKDIIDRTTFKKSKETNKLFYGLEFGIKKNYTLRVVKPLIINGNLLGYIELGKEIDKIINDLSVLLNSHIYMAVDKKIYANATQYVKKELSKLTQTNDYYIPYSTSKIPTQMESILNNTYDKKDIMLENSQYYVSKENLSDVSNKQLGKFIFLSNISNEYKIMYSSVKVLAGVSIVISIILVIFGFILIRKKERNIYDLTSEMKHQKELHELVFKNTNSGVLVIDIEENKFTDCNEAAVKMLECDSKSDVLNLHPAELSPEYQPDGRRSDEKSDDMIAKAIENGSHAFEWMHFTKNQQNIWIEVTLTAVFVNNKKVLHVVWKDIAQKKEAEEEAIAQRTILKYQAHHDALTGLANRILFNDRLEQAIETSKRHNTKLAILFVDLDHFKEVNDSLGHHIGDEILKEITYRIRNLIRDEDTLARLGGDEFSIVIENLVNVQDASTLAQKILNVISEVINIEGNKLYISSSIGISVCPDNGTSVQNLLKYADSAMYKAKDEGRDNFQYYSSEMTELAFERIVMEASFRESLKNEDFVVYYQPQIDGIRDKLIGMEALVRWKHPSMGLVSPDKFIPLAERTGLIVALDRFVMKTAMTQVVKWEKEGLKPGILAMNLSVKQIQQKDFISVLKNLIKETGCKPECIELEITESQIMSNPEEAIEVLSKISNLGIRLAIDDFGTGYSSLSYLKKLPIDKLKIDQSFIKDLPNDAEDAGITKAVIALAKSLNLRVIAEGVEGKEQKDFLIENGCKNIQGYFYSRPIACDEFERVLKEGLK